MSDKILGTEERAEPTGPFVDFSFQLNIGKEKVEKRIYQYLCNISRRLYKEGKSVGVLVVLGCFESEPMVKGMRQLSSAKIDKYINVAFGKFEDEVYKVFESGNDGAIIVNQSGQILGASIYLMVDNPTLDIPEGAGTRHISAASFSTRDDIIATYTLSEENLAVRMWKDGAFTEQFRPEEADDDTEG